MQRANRIHLMRSAHAACRRLGFDDEARHDVQLAVTGKASMRDMDVSDLSKLVSHLNTRRAGRSGYGHPRAPRAHLRLIHVLWGELGRQGVLARPGRAGLNAFIRVRFGPHWSFVPMDVDALTDANNIGDVIRALKAMLARTEANSA